MISGRRFVENLTRLGRDVAISVPCSSLFDLLAAIEEAQGITHIPATCEAEAVGVAAGAWLAGGNPCLIMQNSGFFDSLNAIASLLVPMRAPIPFLVSGRGSFGCADEAHHDLVGRSFLDVAKSLGIPFSICGHSPNDLEQLLENLWLEAEERAVPSVFVLPTNIFGGDAVSSISTPTIERRSEMDHHLEIGFGQIGWNGELICRRDAIAEILGHVPPEAVVIAGVGFVGRELFSMGDRDEYFYLAGAMGCASALGLGLSLRISAPIVILDGDGAALMRLGNFVTIASMRPRKFAHVLFNNGQYESTGGQRSVGGQVPFDKIASACGYAASGCFWDVNLLGRGIRDLMDGSTGSPFFAEVLTEPSARPLARPSVSLAQQARRFRQVF